MNKIIKLVAVVVVAFAVTGCLFPPHHNNQGGGGPGGVQGGGQNSGHMQQSGPQRG